MKYAFKILFAFYIVIFFSQSSGIPDAELVMLLLIAAVIVFKERFYDNLYTAIISFLLIAAIIRSDHALIYLLCLSAFDFIYLRKYWALLPVGLSVILFAQTADLPLLGLTLGISGILAYFIASGMEKEIDYKNRLDDERRLRYELEETKAKLLISSKETAHLTEVRERNRIAREIHDNAGHSIAGILIQLQAARKLYHRDSEKSQAILNKSIDSLAEALTLLRNTVHNIKPQEVLGVAYFQSIIDNFGFCPVEFKSYGDFGSLTSTQLEILASTIREALTNAAKHSKATKVDITIDINERNTRLYIKDNGMGCEKIREGLGISGMRERVLNTGGTISIDSGNGFLIVCLLPLDDRERGGLNEDSDCG